MGRRYELGLAPDPGEVGRARAGARACLAAWGVAGGDGLATLVDAVELVVSELVTNALTHAGGPAWLVLCLDEDGRGLRVEVADPDPHPPSPLPSDPEGQRGRGLVLVAAVALGWSWRRCGPGKVVTCRLALPEWPGSRTGRAGGQPG